MTTHTHVAARRLTLASGRPLAAEEQCTPGLDAKGNVVAHDQALIDEGYLIKLDPPAKAKKED